MAEVPIYKLRTGEIVAYAMVDDADLELVNAHRWGYFVSASGKVYPSAKGSILMHRLILGLTCGDGVQVDHYDGNPLNNRRSNLRRATAALNQQNRPSQTGSSRYRGVYWHKKHGRWAASAQLNRKHIHIGLFADELAAAMAAAEWRAAHMPFTVEPLLEAA